MTSSAAYSNPGSDSVLVSIARIKHINALLTRCDSVKMELVYCQSISEKKDSIIERVQMAVGNSDRMIANERKLTKKALKERNLSIGGNILLIILFTLAIL
jgi:hypothetical protein